MLRLHLLTAICLIPFTLGTTTKAIAQVTSAGDGTGTIVTQTGNEFTVTGGSLSGDGSNLFHNFGDFNLTSSQSANFFANPSIQNILSRISGGNPSYIDGLISVSNSNANLFLLNSNGLIFGSNAQLNVAGDFTASTAMGLGFGDEIWLDGTDFSDFNGNPTQFLLANTGTIINAADLTVNSGQTINLFANNVINTGSLTSDEGTIQVLASPDSGTIRLSQTGQILSLELTPNSTNLTALSLPQLLTGSGINTGLTLDNGQISLASDGTVISQDPGNTFVSGILNASGNIGGNISVFGESVDLVAATLDASGINGGGTILVGGDYQGQGTLPTAQNTFVDSNSLIDAGAIADGNGGRVIVWADNRTDFDGFLDASGGTNSGDGGFAEVSGKNILDIPAGWSQRIDVGSTHGAAGTLLFDPVDISIVSVGGGSFTPSPSTNSVFDIADINAFLLGGSLTLTTSNGDGGSGNITIEDGLLFGGAGSNALTLEADNNITFLTGVLSTTSFNAASTTLDAGGDIISASAYTIDLGTKDLTLRAGRNINVGVIQGFGGNATLRAGGTINTDSIAIVGGDATLIATDDIQVTSIDTPEFSTGPGGNIDVVTGSLFRATDTISGVNSLNSSGPDGAGDISITHSGGSSTPFIVGDASSNGTAGAITTGVETISPNRSFSGDYRQGTSGNGQISILSIGDLPECLVDCGDTQGTLPVEEDNLSLIQAKLEKVHEQAGVNPALIYAFFRKPDSVQNSLKEFSKDAQSKTKANSEQWKYRGDRLSDFLNAAERFLQSPKKRSGDEQLELVMVTYSGKVIRKQFPEITRASLTPQANAFRRGITSPRLTKTYLKPAQELNNAFLAPLVEDIEAEEIDSLSFVMDDGFRALPIAALHDGESFLIEKYNVGLMPSFSLTNTSGYVAPRENQLLAMGASEFTLQEDLPAASLEVTTIADQIWQGDTFLEQQFTVDNLLKAREQNPYGIVHLATHAEFRSGQDKNSYIQFSDQQVSIADLGTLRLSEPAIELLVLSACRTALGDRQAELGFAGLALTSGAKSAIGSLWYVSDTGTFGLMTRLYEELQTQSIKAEALRQAQLSLLRGDVRMENGQLVTPTRAIAIPPEATGLNRNDLSHPYFWSGFTLVGNPW